MRPTTIILTALVLCAGPACSQTANTPATRATNVPPLTIDKGEQKAWSVSISASTYIVPDGREYVRPTITADRGWLHLEARYNYEALDTASAWMGYNFSGGEKLACEFTPMLGGVCSDTDGLGHSAGLRSCHVGIGDDLTAR